MAFTFKSAFGWFGRLTSVLGEKPGKQANNPTVALVSDTSNPGPDGAMQLSTVWNCIERRAMVVSSLPFFAYQLQQNGQKDLARTSRLYAILHDSPNSRMTPLEFWRAMMMNHDLRGNAYARLDRDERTREVLAMWPMPADQVETEVLEDGSMVYYYRLGNNVAVLAAENVLHLKNLGNGTVGLPKLEYMRATVNEAANAQSAASRLFANGGKPTGLLMVDGVLGDEARQKLKSNFAEMAMANTSRLFVLEASMKYQPISLTPEDQELLATRKFSIEEICRWFDVPPVLAHHSNVTTWGSAVETIIDGWHKLSVRPILVNIEQAVTKRVLTPAQRARMSVEFNHDALLRGNIKDRFEVYAKGTQNGIMTRNEARQLENLPPMPGGDELTAQSNLLPLAMLGQVKPGASHAATQDPVAQ